MNREGICDLLDEAEVEYSIAGDNVAVILPGEKRLKTNCLLIPQNGMFRVEAFICRNVEEAFEDVYRMLLQANRRTFGVHYTVDAQNDIYLVGQLPDSTTAEDIQRVLGQVLERADQDFNRILERGFASSIRHEWAWRLTRGEPTMNLQAFTHLRPDDDELQHLAPPPGSRLVNDIHTPSSPSASSRRSQIPSRFMFTTILFSFTREVRNKVKHSVGADQPGLRVINCIAGPYEGLAKSDLPTQLVAFTGSILAFAKDIHYDIIHSHYWLSGQVGWLLSDIWDIPWVHTAHTLAAVKNNYLADGDAREPESRRICEQQIVDNADLLIVNTQAEVEDLIQNYDAAASNIEVVAPGADIACFTPGTGRATERTRRELGIPLRAKVIAFIGRLQKLKGPHILLRAAAAVAERTEEPITIVICGGNSGNNTMSSDSLAPAADSLEYLQRLARELRIDRCVRFLSPRPPEELANVYQAADIVAVPSYNESFGLVALEAQACGTPVIATRVGGLPIAVNEGESGLLVEGHDPEDWADAIEQLVVDDERRVAMSEFAPIHAAKFTWQATAERLKLLYEDLPPAGFGGERQPAG